MSRYKSKILIAIYSRVYCRYHYLEGHEFKSPEEELQHFVQKIDDDNINFKWRHQYEVYEEASEDEGTSTSAVFFK